MKKILLILVIFAAIATSCLKNSALIQVTNELNFDRVNETVEVSLSRVKNIAPVSELVVINSKGEQIPSQICDSVIIFQATVAANSISEYFVVKESPKNHQKNSFGRLIPERKDDFAWENNKIAFRMYGPALEATGELSNGIDVWVKSTEDLIIDKWYAPGVDYHTDNGPGLDYYKVGRTLGAGAMAPFVGDSLHLGRNFINAQIVDSGAVRTTFKLTYAPYKVGEIEVTEQRIVSLDAHSSFNKISEIYSGDFEEMDVAAGIVMHKDGRVAQSTNGVAIFSEAQTSDGVTHIAVIVPYGSLKDTIQNHLAITTKAYKNQSVTYYNGAGWSKGGYATDEDWKIAVETQVKKIKNPLKITVK